MDYIIAVVIFSVGIGLGSVIADNETLQDCAVKSHARLTSGAVIECTVRKDQS